MGRVVGIMAVLAVAAGAGAAGWLLARSQSTETTVASVVETATAVVVRADLATTETFDGRLQFADLRTVRTAAPGTITALAGEADRLQPGQILFEINGIPVPLLSGDRPAWRPFLAGMADGPDVRQLEENLVTLGYGDALTVDDEFAVETGDAIEAFRDDLGLPEGRSIELGAVVFLPGPVRVGALLTEVGAIVLPGTPIVEVSSSRQEVVIELDPERVKVMNPGAIVEVILPDDRRVPGTIAEVGRVARPVSPEPDAPRVILVRITLIEAVLDLDQAPVNVEVVTELAEDVLAVPVRALLALSEGGYAVEVQRGAETVLVGVELGTFAEGLVEVSGGLAEGDLVVIPK